MKVVAILLLAVLMSNGCGNSNTAAQVAAAATWQAVLSGGDEQASGFSFTTQFTVGGDGTLSITSFQFLTNNNGVSCFPISGESVSGNMLLTVNTTTQQVTGTFTYVVPSGGNTLTLNGNVTGTATITTSTTTLSTATITGTWTFVGSGTPAGCNNTSGSFTMTEPTTTTG